MSFYASARPYRVQPLDGSNKIKEYVSRVKELG